MTVAEYKQLDEFTQIRVYRNFCTQYNLDPTQSVSRSIFYVVLDDNGTTTVTDQNGTQNVIVKA